MRTLLVLGVLAALSSALHAQQGPTLATSLPTFEVTSIKVNKSGDAATSLDFHEGGRFNATNASFRYLFRNAYLVQDHQVMGMPDWATADRFDIAAKAESDLRPTPPFGPAGPRQFVLQSLLADRFKMTVHKETRDLPIFALTLAREDRKLGPKMISWKGDCPDPEVAEAKQQRRCGTAFSMGQASRLSSQTPMAVFVQALGFLVNRVVVDRTGLTGVFDMELAWTREPSPDSPQPSIFTALQEQLGLKLESTRGPVEVLVIDHVEQPTPD